MRPMVQFGVVPANKAAKRGQLVLRTTQDLWCWIGVATRCSCDPNEASGSAHASEHRTQNFPSDREIILGPVIWYYELLVENNATIDDAETSKTEKENERGG
jgi:hypothetical protein